MALRLNPILFVADGSAPAFDRSVPGSHVIQYEVVGLPHRSGALIGKKEGHWQILRVKDNIPDIWRGRYQTAEAALAALEAGEGGPGSHAT